MAYALDNALYQWEEGERRLREAVGRERHELERGTAAVLDELRRRLGTTFSVAELAELYGRDSGWAEESARVVPGADVATVVDAAFARYARWAGDYAGGRTHERDE